MFRIADPRSRPATISAVPARHAVNTPSHRVISRFAAPGAPVRPDSHHSGLVYGLDMLALVLVAVSVGLSNLAASVGLGTGGIDRAVRLRVLVVFGSLEAAMPVIGLLLGRSLAAGIGSRARWLAAGLLVAVGGYTLFQAARAGRRLASGRVGAPGAAVSGPGAGAAGQRVGGASPDGGLSAAVTGSRGAWLGLLISGVALSLDNLVAGFALGAYRVNLIIGALIFGVVSAAMSMVGLEFGARIGRRIGSQTEFLGGLILIAVGVAIALGLLG